MGQVRISIIRRPESPWGDIEREDGLVEINGRFSISQSEAAVEIKSHNNGHHPEAVIRWTSKNGHKLEEAQSFSLPPEGTILAFPEGELLFIVKHETSR